MPTFRSASKVTRDPLQSSLLDQNRSKRRNAKALHEQQSLAPMLRNDPAPDLSFELVAVERLKVTKAELRTLTDADVQEVANSISQLGFCDPILIDEDDHVIDGASRLKAAMLLGMTEVRCVRAMHLSPAQKKAAAIAFNRIGAKRQWDVGMLKVELLAIEEAGQPTHSLGFSSVELDQIFAVEDKPARKKAKVADTRPPVSVAGDLWQLGDHLLLCGDATDPACYEQLLGDERVQLVCTDPPYNVKIADIVSTPHDEFCEASGEMSDEAFDAFLLAFLACCYKVIADGGMAYAFMDWRHIDQLIGAGKANRFELVNIIVWVKANGGMGSMLRSQHELIAAFKKPGTHKNNVGLGKHGRDRTNVWYAEGAGTAGSEARAMLASHPTSKPPQLLEEAMYDVTDRGDLVLDPFGGSGSTLIAAHRAKRVARLIEKQPGYCDLILRRWLAETGIMPVHVVSGESFAEREVHAASIPAIVEAEVSHAC